MLNSEPKFFPHLDQFLGGWFHQDYDMVGETIEEIVKAYCTVEPREVRADLISDIDRFLALPKDNLDEELDSFNAGGIYLPAWKVSARQFLQRVRDGLLAG